MSREFTEASGYLLRDSGGIPAFAYPISICLWMNVPANDQNAACGWLIGNGDQWGVEIQATDHVLLAHWNNTAWAYTATQGNTFTRNAWSHVAVVMTNSTTWRVVINGDWANSGTYGGSARSLNQPTQICIGMFSTNLAARIDGMVAHWALWGDIALSQAQVEALAGPFSGGAQTGSGANPLAIANHKLLAYLPLVGTASPEPDEKNDYDFTIYEGAPQGASDPDVDAPPQFMRPEADGSVAWTRYPALLSRDFDRASQQYATVSSLPAITYPFTIAFWFRIPALPTVGEDVFSLMSVVSESSNDYHDCQVVHTTGYARVFITQGGVGSENHITTNAVTTGAWQHYAYIATSATSRRAVLNGDWANSYHNTNTLTPASLTRVSVGVLDFYNDNYNFTEGMIARPTLWDAALVQADIEDLAAGANPYSVGSPRHYWPFGGNDSPEPDVAGGYDMTLVGPPTQGASGPTISGSRDLNGTTQELRGTYPLSSASPETFTVAGWFNSGSASGGAMCLWSLGDADADQYWEIRRHTTDAIRATQTPDFDSSITSNTAPVDTWFHVAHVCRNDAGTYRHRVVLDGDWANSTEAPYTRPTGLDLLTIGALRFNANDFISLNGMVAHFAVWDGAVLSQAQVEALAVGADPRTIQSTNLIQYCRIAGSVSPEPDIVGTYDLTLVGSPTRADGPTVDGITISSNFEAVNEAVASDAEYVYAASAGLLDSYDVPTYDDPGTDEGFVVRYDVKQLTGGAGVEARMYQTGLPASVLLYVDWEHGVLASGTFTSDTPNVPDAHTFTFTNSATVGAEGTWDGQYVATFPNFNSVVSSVLSSATMAVTQGRVLVELEGMDSAGDGVGFYAASPANGRINIFLTGGGEVWVNLDWQGSNNKQIDLGAEPSGKYKVEIIYDTQNGTSSQRFRARCWAGDTPPSFTDSDNFGSADDTDQFTALRVPLNGDAHPTRLGRIIICNDITLDLSTITLAPETLISADPVQRFTAGTYEWAVDSADVANITDRSAVRVAVYSL